MGKSSGDPARKERLQKLRQAFGISQKDVADRGGLKLQAITMLEGGYTIGLRIDRRVQYARGYGLTAAQFARLLNGTIAVEDAIDASRWGRLSKAA